MAWGYRGFSKRFTTPWERVAGSVGDRAAGERVGLLMWGSNDAKQLGQHFAPSKPFHLRPEYFENKSLRMVSCGARTTAAVDQDGELWTWGEPDHYLLGWVDEYGKGINSRSNEEDNDDDDEGGSKYDADDDDEMVRITPQTARYEFSNITRANEEDFEPHHSLKQLDHSLVASPRWCFFFEGADIKQVEMGEHASFAITGDGELYAWGRHVIMTEVAGGEPGQKEQSFGCTGIPFEKAEGGYVKTPTKVEFPEPDHDAKVVHVKCGTYHAMAVLDNGAVYGWGRGSNGRLGITKKSRRRHENVTPVKLDLVDPRIWGIDVGEIVDLDTLQLACGGHHSFIVGNGDAKIFPDGRRRPGRGYTLGLGLNSDGQVWSGELRGKPVDSNYDRAKIVQMESPWPPSSSQPSSQPSTQPSTQLSKDAPDSATETVPHFDRIAAGKKFSVGLSKDGTVYQWGKNVKSTGPERLEELSYGRIMYYKELLGAATKGDKLSNYDIVDVDAGSNYAAALSACGKVFTWGGVTPALGIGVDHKADKPIMLGARDGPSDSVKFPKIVGISCGRQHMAALCVLEDDVSVDVTPLPGAGGTALAASDDAEGALLRTKKALDVFLTVVEMGQDPNETLGSDELKALEDFSDFVMVEIENCKGTDAYDNIVAEIKAEIEAAGGDNDKLKLLLEEVEAIGREKGPQTGSEGGAAGAGSETAA